MKLPFRALILCAATVSLLGTATPAAFASAGLVPRPESAGPRPEPPLTTSAHPASPAPAHPQTSPAVLHVGQIDQQDVAAAGGCEADTLVEPEVAVSPFNSNLQVAVAHDCRFANGGAVDISYAWTSDGGAHWHHAAMPGLTKAVGGVWDRASDPVVAFGPDGTVYVSALVFDNGCPTGVTVSRSTNGGATFGKPVLVQQSKVCTNSDDKDWLIVDTQPTSPFFGRVYVFWTAFLSSSAGQSTGVPQVLRWSDDGGKTWSATHEATATASATQDSQPAIQPDGALTDTYNFFGKAAGSHTPTVPSVRPHVGVKQGTIPAGVTVLARTSFDGGVTWANSAVVTNGVGFGPTDVRCCLAAATADPVTGTMYAAWEGNGPGALDPVELTSSTDGQHWTAPIQVTPDPTATTQHVNLAIAAFGGKVYVTYGTRDMTVDQGNLVQQELSTSTDGGATFGPSIDIGPTSNLLYAAVAGGKFPGDYIGASATSSRLTLAWCVSFKPASPARVFHQVLYGAVLHT